MKVIRINLFERLYHRRFEVIAKLVSSSGGGLVLDLGCGNGVIFKYMANRANTVIGVDLFPHNWWAIAKKNASKFGNVDLIKADINHLPFRDGISDIVLTADVLEHFKNLELVLKNISSVLKDGGNLIMTAPTENLLYWFLRVPYRGQPTYKSSKSSPIPDFHYHNSTEILNESTNFFTVHWRGRSPFNIPLWDVLWLRSPHEKKMTKTGDDKRCR